MYIFCNRNGFAKCFLLVSYGSRSSEPFTRGGYGSDLDPILDSAFELERVENQSSKIVKMGRKGFKLQYYLKF
jgi:hypothetical protein